MLGISVAITISKEYTFEASFDNNLCIAGKVFTLGIEMPTILIKLMNTIKCFVSIDANVRNLTYPNNC